MSDGQGFIKLRDDWSMLVNGPAAVGSLCDMLKLRRDAAYHLDIHEDSMPMIRYRQLMQKRAETIQAHFAARFAEFAERRASDGPKRKKPATPFGAAGMINR